MRRILPINAQSFDLHMRSMLDQCTIRSRPDRSEKGLEANWKACNGRHVDGGKHGRRTIDRQLKEVARPILT